MIVYQRQVGSLKVIEALLTIAKISIQLLTATFREPTQARGVIESSMSRYSRGTPTLLSKTSQREISSKGRREYHRKGLLNTLNNRFNCQISSILDRHLLKADASMWGNSELKSRLQSTTTEVNLKIKEETTLHHQSFPLREFKNNPSCRISSLPDRHNASLQSIDHVG